jgi:cellulose synthase/poly-beta-1,6-N-acetylglucosamine synthase-like glycosyltransferase
LTLPILNKNKTLQNYHILLDPIIILSIIAVCGAYIFLGTYVMTPLTLLVFLIFLGFLYYPLIHRKEKPKLVVHPAIILFVLMPCSFVVALLFEQNEVTSIPLQLLVTYNYTITLISILILLPLALWGKLKQSSLMYNKNYVPSISVLIPAYNEEKIIERTIISVLDSDYPNKELIVINNASTDKTSNILKKYQNKIKIMDEPKKGKAIAINTGIRNSTGEIIIILDADTIVSLESFRNIVQPFYNNPKMGAVTGNVKILNPNNFHTKIQVLEYALASQIAKAAFATQGAVTVVSGAFGAFRRSVVDECSPFSNDTLTEDLDATMTILKKGYSATIQDLAIAHTEAPTSLPDLIKQRTRWYRGLFQSYSKHPELLRKISTEYTSSFIYSLMFNSSLIVPLIGIVNLVAIVYLTFIGSTLAIQFILLNAIAMAGLFTVSLRLNKDSLRYMKLFPLAFIYLRIHDFIFIKTMIQHALKRESKWDHITRVGDNE